MLPTRVLAFLLLGVASAACAGPSLRPSDVALVTEKRSSAILDQSVMDIDGINRRPFNCGSKKASVVFFMAHDCPISNSYAPEMNRLCKQYGDKVTFCIVHPYAELTLDEAKKHAEAFGYTVPVIIDTKRKLAPAVGATITPEVAVIEPSGKVLYLGRIDDKWAGFGKSRVEPTTRDLRGALEAVLAGKPVLVNRTEAIGCPI